ncbi:MAG: DUF4352 domain-containing protein [Micromonosporaceae bacterium]
MIGAVVLLCLVCGGGIALLMSGGDSGGNGAPGVDDTGTTEKPAKVGEPVRDGKFEFVVKKVQCGVNEVGDEDFGEQAQGQFCLVTLSVKNIGDEAQPFADSDQKAFGANGKEYSADSDAGLVANENPDTFFADINPGNTLDGVVVFDIPADAELATIELHDSLASGGARVTV